MHNLTAEDGKLKFGTHTLDLLLPPISFRENENPSHRTGAQLNFTVMDPDEVRENTA